MLECDEGINTHCDPQRESCPLVRPLSGWTIRCHNGLDMSLGPIFNQISGCPVTPPQGSTLESLIWWDT